MIPKMKGSSLSSSSSSSSSPRRSLLLLQQLPLLLLLIIMLIIINNNNNGCCCHSFSSPTTISTIITSPSSSSPFIMAPTKNLLFLTNPRRRRRQRRRRTQRRSSTRSTTCWMVNYATPDDEEIKGDDNNNNNSLSVSTFFSSSGIDLNNIEDTFQVQAVGRIEEEEGEVVYSAEISGVDGDDKSNSNSVVTTTVFWSIHNNNNDKNNDDNDHDHDDDDELIVDIGDKKYSMIKEALLGEMNKCWIVKRQQCTTMDDDDDDDDDDNNNTNTNTNAIKIRVNNPEELRQAVSSVKVMNNSSLLLDCENKKPPPPYFILADDDDDDDDTCYINRDAIDISTLKRRYRTNELHCIDDENAIIIYSANLINFDTKSKTNNNRMLFWTIYKDNTTNDDEKKIENNNENNNNNNDEDPFSVIYSAYNDEQMKFIELFHPSDVTTKLRIITSRIVRSVSYIIRMWSQSGVLGWWMIYDDSTEEKEEEQKQGTTNEEIVMNRKKRLSMLSMGLLSGGGWMWLWKANHQPSSLLGYRTIITQFLNDCLYGATTGILSNHTYFQILGKSIVLLLFLRFIMIDLLLKKLVGRRIISNNNDYLWKPIGINSIIVQNLSTISLMISNVMLLSNSVLQFLFLAYIKFPIFIILKLLSSILLRISNNINDTSVFPTSDKNKNKDKQSIKLKKEQYEEKSLLKNLSLKIRTVADEVLLWKVAPSNKSSLVSLATSDDDNNSNVNGNINKSFIRINAAFLGPIKEELIFRYAFDKIWHVVEGFLFSMMSTRSALILGSGNTMKETASAVIADGGSLSANTPAWIWMNSLLFGLTHIGNWFPIRKDNIVASTSSNCNAWDNIYGALFQCTISFIGARFLFNPLYTKRGIAASIGAHIALNTFVMAFSFGGNSKPTDDKENSNEEC